MKAQSTSEAINKSLLAISYRNGRSSDATIDDGNTQCAHR